MTGKAGIFVKSISAPNPAGKARGKFSVNPPPVICAKACTPPNLIAAKHCFTYNAVGLSNASPRLMSANGALLSQNKP